MTRANHTMKLLRNFTFGNDNFYVTKAATLLDIDHNFVPITSVSPVPLIMRRTSVPKFGQLTKVFF